MRAHVSAVVVEKFIIDCKDMAVPVDGRAHLVVLLARVIGRDQMLAPVLDPFDRTAEFQRGRADQHVFRINFAADAEAATDMALVELDGFGCAAKHLRQRVAIPVRHLGGAVQFQNVARSVVARDGAARFQRHAGVAADRKLKRNNGVRSAEGGIDVAIGFLQD